VSAAEPGFFRKRPWLFVVAAFVLLIIAWTVLITIAVKNRPEDVANPLQPEPKSAMQNKGDSDGR
jgi:hypothetical protein